MQMTESMMAVAALLGCAAMLPRRFERNPGEVCAGQRTTSVGNEDQEPQRFQLEKINEAEERRARRAAIKERNNLRSKRQ